MKNGRQPFKMMPRCKCGKIAYPNKNAARNAVSRHRHEMGGPHKTAYKCRLAVGHVWHIGTLARDRYEYVSVGGA